MGLKWVFKAKKDAAGNAVGYKACLAVQSFSQVSGVDYFDTPVAKLESIWAVLVIAAQEDLEVHQIDIKGEYLYGGLQENEVMFMAQPPGFHAPNSAVLVCRLKKTLYGLKQLGMFSDDVYDCRAAFQPTKPNSATCAWLRVFGQPALCKSVPRSATGATALRCSCVGSGHGSWHVFGAH